MSYLSTLRYIENMQKKVTPRQGSRICSSRSWVSNRSLEMVMMTQIAERIYHRVHSSDTSRNLRTPLNAIKSDYQ